jgi:uncharacterized membrane protein YqjE
MGILAGIACMVWLPSRMQFGRFLPGPLDVITIVLFVIPPLGSLWMLFDSFYHEKNPWPYVLVAFIPWVFLWYYFTRVTHSGESPLSSRNDRVPAGESSAEGSGDKVDRSRGGDVDQLRKESFRTRQGGARIDAITVADHVIWACFFCITSGFALLQFWGAWRPRSTLDVTVLALFYTVHFAGTLWMLVHSMKSHRQSLPFFLLAPVPYSFFWYFFNRRDSKTEMGGERNDEISAGSNTEARPGGSGKPSLGSSERMQLRVLHTVGWACLLCLTSAFSLWVVLADWVFRNELEVVGTVVFFAIHPFGAIWMLSHATRNERRRLPFFFLAFIPYSFVWYYFERVGRSPRCLAEPR